jgi:5-methylcytosine-specific restriction enzyme subunit McrC
MQTDILLTIGERTLIVDTKYYTKILQGQYGNETLRNSHLYQIRTYVDEYDREHTHKVDGMLLYAKTKENDFEDAQITHRDGYTLYIRTLDLNTDFEAIRRRLDCFVK